MKKRTPDMALLPADKRASIAVDLGAESCRVSLLRWLDDKAEITLVHRFANAPREVSGGLHWDLEMIEAGLVHGLRRCAVISVEGVRWLSVDWGAVGVVVVGAGWEDLGGPFGLL